MLRIIIVITNFVGVNTQDVAVAVSNISNITKN